MRWKSGWHWRRLLAVAATAWLAAATPGVTATAAAAASPANHSHFTHQLLAKAQPDECFAGLGVPYPPGPPCAQGQPKVDQAYVWGLTQVGNHVWFGTGANVNCLVTGFTIEVVKPILNDDYVCEYGESQVAKANPDLPASLGDQRPPEVFYYDTRSRRLVPESAKIDAASSTDAERRKLTLGLRAGGSFQGVVLLGGPGLDGGINLFAFDGDSGKYLGSTELTQYGNIRHFYVADGALYMGAGVGYNGGDGGVVLRWTGSKANPFSFVDVGDLLSQAADMTLYDGRLFVSTWPQSGQVAPQYTAGVWMSPPLKDGAPGLNPADAAGWTLVWNATEYEPDPLIARTYGMGGIASYDGYLYWGTMHVPMKATKVFRTLHPPADDAAAKAAVVNTQRAAAIFRGKDFGTDTQQIQLLYGNAQLPAYDAKANGGAGAWSAKPTGYTPLYGSSGFGNGFNNYEWVMTVTAGKLFIGTMDWSYLAKDLLPPGTGNIDPSKYGGELWMFDCANEPAKAIDTTGVGNYLNYGVRNMIADGDTLYLGMADPMNLRTDPTDDVPEGGWELIKMTAK
jgi:hypothetical protein